MSRKRLLRKLFGEHYSWLLGLVLIGAFLIRVVNLNYNSPFLDEAIYINLGKHFWNGAWPDLALSTSWVGGFPFLYPPLTAAFYALGGIEFSRFLNVIFGMALVYLTYRLTREIIPIPDKKQSCIAAVVAAGLMATSAIPIVLSRLATYDALSVLLFLAGIWQLAKAVWQGESSCYLKAAILLFGAFLAKYIVAIYIPLLLLMTLYLAWKTGKRYVLEGILSSFWLPLVLLSLVFIIANFSSLADFFSVKAYEKSSGPIAIISSFLKYSPLIYLASLPSFYLMYRKKAFGLAGILGFGATLPLFAHLAFGESQSVYQHSIYPLVFLLPIIGAAAAVFLERFKVAVGFVVVLLILLNYLLAVPRVRALESFWPNTNEAVEFLKVRAQDGNRILAESEDPIALGLRGAKNPRLTIEGPFDFTMQNLEGKAAYLQAIQIGYFNFIELDGIFFSRETTGEMAAVIGDKYLLAYERGRIKIWELKK